MHASLPRHDGHVAQVCGAVKAVDVVHWQRHLELAEPCLLFVVSDDQELHQVPRVTVMVSMPSSSSSACPWASTASRAGGGRIHRSVSETCVEHQRVSIGLEALRRPVEAGGDERWWGFADGAEPILVGHKLVGDNLIQCSARQYRIWQQDDGAAIIGEASPAVGGGIVGK